MQAILPYLFVLACPVGMGIMLFFMLRMMRQPQEQTPQRPLNSMAEGSAPSAPPQRGRTREEQIAELRARLEDSQAQQEQLARELARQERAERHHLEETKRRG